MTQLADLTWPEVEGHTQAGNLLVVPVGSTEQHGPHLPLSTDTDIAVALSLALARHRGDVVVAPPLPYGASGEHADFPGTLSIGQEATELLLVELGRSASLTFDRILFLSAHGGNAVPVARAVRRLRAEGRDAMAWSPKWHGDAHAGRTETALQLTMDPTRVLIDRAAPGATGDLAELLPSLRRDGIRAVSPNGVLGDPAGATAAEGARLLSAAAGDLIRTVEAWLA
jgi:creatinine amidohydrolase